ADCGEPASAGGRTGDEESDFDQHHAGRRPAEPARDTRVYRARQRDQRDIYLSSDAVAARDAATGTQLACSSSVLAPGLRGAASKRDSSDEGVRDSGVW